MPDPIPTPTTTPAVPITSAPAPAEAESMQEPSTETSQGAEPPKAEEPNGAKVARAVSAAIAEKNKRVAAEARAAKAEADLAAAHATAKDASAKLDLFKKDPMGALEAVGMTYEEITKAAIAKHGKDTPAARIEAIEAKLKADDAARAKAQEESTAQATARASAAKVAEYVGNVHAFALADKAGYELMAGLEPDYAKNLIHDVADGLTRRDGKVPTPKEVCDSIEEYFVEEAVKWAGSAKVKAKLAPPAPVAPPAEPVNPAVQAALDAQKKRNERTAPRTLTNKLAAAPVEKPPEAGKKLSPQEAMRAAMEVYRQEKAKQV